MFKWILPSGELVLEGMWPEWKETELSKSKSKSKSRRCNQEGNRCLDTGAVVA
jgi:hypothetical protein